MARRPKDLHKAAHESRSMSLPLPVIAKLHIVSHRENLHSPNVIARLQGSDPALHNEYVVYTAHSDNVGIRQSVDGGCYLQRRARQCIRRCVPAGNRQGILSNDSAPAPLDSIRIRHGRRSGPAWFGLFCPLLDRPKGSIGANIAMETDLMVWPLEDVIRAFSGCPRHLSELR